MKHHLAVTDGKVIYTPAFSETVGDKVMSLLIPKVTLGEMDMDDAYLSSCFVRLAGMLFFYFGYFKQVKNAFWK